MYQTMSLRIALYGEGVACLKKHMRLMYDLAEKLELPEEAVTGAAKLTVTGAQRALIENHRGILEYGPERIFVSTERVRLLLSGTSLGIGGLARRDLLVTGKLQHVEWE